ncbi:hypothetical protein BH10PLA2_BH10PLA2_11230 [soil metagenome]
MAKPWVTSVLLSEPQRGGLNLTATGSPSIRPRLIAWIRQFVIIFGVISFTALPDRANLLALQKSETDENAEFFQTKREKMGRAFSPGSTLPHQHVYGRIIPLPLSLPIQDNKTMSIETMSEFQRAADEAARG